MAGPPNIRGVGAEFTVEGIPSTNPNISLPRPYSRTLPLRLTTYTVDHDGEILWATRTETRENNRLVSKWRSEQLRYMVWGGSTVLCLQRHYYNGARKYCTGTTGTTTCTIVAPDRQFISACRIGMLYAYIRNGYGDIHDSPLNAKTSCNVNSPIQAAGVGDFAHIDPPT
jgi:hypothetical protein